MRKMLVALGLLGMLGVVAVALAQTAGTNATERNGYYFNSSNNTKTDIDGNTLVTQSTPIWERVLSPTLIYSGTIAAGAADSSDIVDLSGYKTVALLVQCGEGSTNSMQRFAVNARYNLGGASDSLSMFTIPVTTYDDSVAFSAASGRVVFPAAGALGAGEFPVTILHSNTGAGAAVTSIPQGKIVYLTLPPSGTWPARCSFRFRNIARLVANTPSLRVWVMGTSL